MINLVSLPSACFTYSTSTYTGVSLKPASSLTSSLIKSRYLIKVLSTSPVILVSALNTVLIASLTSPVSSLTTSAHFNLTSFAK